MVLSCTSSQRLQDTVHSFTGRERWKGRQPPHSDSDLAKQSLKNAWQSLLWNPTVLIHLSSIKSKQAGEICSSFLVLRRRSFVGTHGQASPRKKNLQRGFLEQLLRAPCPNYWWNGVGAGGFLHILLLLLKFSNMYVGGCSQVVMSEFSFLSRLLVSDAAWIIVSNEVEVMQHAEKPVFSGGGALTF